MTRPHRTERALLLAGLSVGTSVLVGLLGPSSAVPPLGRPPGPLPAWAPAALLGFAVGTGLLACLAGLRDGAARGGLWASALCTAALVCVAPVGNADLLSYAAYGRIAATGGDPYAQPPQPSSDPVRAQVEDPWRHTPSVYGPLATAEQAVVARLAGDRVAALPRALAGVNGLAFWLTGWLLTRLARRRGGDPRRACWLWSLNPVALLLLVGGGHLDALVALAVVAACSLGRAATVAGTAAALAVKVTSGWALLGVAWRRHWAAAAGAALAGTGYLLAGPHVLDQARRASRQVSAGTPWRPVASGLERLTGSGPARLAVASAAVVLALVTARLLLSRLPEGPEPARSALAGGLAWTLAAPYALPWYDAVPLALLALLAASRFDRLLLAHLGVLAVAYLPGRVVALPPALSAGLTGWRSVVTPVVLTAVWASCLRSAPDHGPEP